MRAQARLHMHQRHAFGRGCPSTCKGRIGVAKDQDPMGTGFLNGFPDAVHHVTQTELAAVRARSQANVRLWQLEFFEKLAAERFVVVLSSVDPRGLPARRVVQRPVQAVALMNCGRAPITIITRLGTISAILHPQS